MPPHPKGEEPANRDAAEDERISAQSDAQRQLQRPRWNVHKSVSAVEHEPLASAATES